MNPTFKINSETNILDGITLYEPIERHILEKLINSSLLREDFNNILARIYQNEKQQLQRYLDKMVNGRIPVHYTRSLNNPYGRSNPDHSLGLYSIRREIRHTLAGNRFVDIDIENCHPQMLNQICNNENMPHPHLMNYCSNRDRYLYMVIKHYGCDREKAKKLFIILLYGGGFKKWIEANEITPEMVLEHDKTLVNEDTQEILELTSIREFRLEMADINTRVLESNPKLKTIVIENKLKQGKDKFNLGGTMCSFMLQEYEIRILEQLFLYCSENGYIKNGIAVLCADGMMIEKKYYNADLLKILEGIIYTKVGFRLVMIEKKMDMSYLSILDKNLIFDLYTPSYSTGMISQYFATLYANKFIYYDGILYYYNGIYWEKHKKHAILHNFIDCRFYKHMVGYCSRVLAIQNKLLEVADEEKTKMVEVIIQRIKCLLSEVQSLRVQKQRQHLIDDILNKITNENILWDDHPYLFVFNNKIFDLQQNKFIESTYDLYCSTTCGFDYCDYYSRENITLMKSLIETILPNENIREYYLTALSTALCGIQIQNFFIATGTGGNGKSVLNSTMLKMMGDYGYKLGSRVISDEMKGGGNPEVALLHKKRFVLIQEPIRDRKICCSTLKEITGDKTLNARMNYSNQCNVSLCLSLFMECNVLPLLDEVGGAVERRIRAIPFNSRFIGEKEFHLLDHKEGYGIANPYYTTEDFQIFVRQALFEILLEYWARFQKNKYTLLSPPQECSDITINYLSNSDEIFGWFNEEYQKGDPEVDILFIDDIYKTFTCSPLWYSMSKTEQRNMNKKKFTENFENSIFLGRNYRPRNAYFKSIQFSKPFLIG